MRNPGEKCVYMCMYSYLWLYKNVYIWAEEGRWNSERKEDSLTNTEGVLKKKKLFVTPM